MEQINQKKINKENIGNVCFYMALLIELLIVIVDKSNYTMLYEGKYFQLTFLLFFIKVLLTKYSYKEWGLIFAFGLLGALSYFITDRNEIIRLVMMIVASKNISLKIVMQVTFWITLAGVSTLILLSVTGIYGNVYMIANFRDTVEELRYCLGLGHPNALHCMVWALITLGLYLYLDKMKGYHFLLLTFINTVFYLLTDSRTGMLITFATIILGIILRYSIKFRSCKEIYNIGIIGFLLSILFSIISATPKIWFRLLEIIDKAVTNRISLTRWYSPSSTWTLFSDPTHEQYLDMGFVRLFDWYGIIPALVFVLVVCIMIWDCKCNKNYKAFLLIVSFIVYTIFEAHAISVYLMRNYMLMLLIGTWPSVFYVSKGKEIYAWNILPLNKK